VDEVAGRAVFLADSADDGESELWSAPLAGPEGAAVHLSLALANNGDVEAFDSGGGFVAYAAETVSSNQANAFVVPIEGPFSQSVPLHGALPVEREVDTLRMVPSEPAPTVLLFGNLRHSTKSELYLQDLEGADAPHPLFGDLPPGTGYESSCGTVQPASFEFVVLCADLNTAGKVELFRVPVTFDGAPERLSAAFGVAGADVTRVISTPDATWVAFRADSGLDEQFNLYRARTDGAGVAERVHASPSSDRDVDAEQFAFTRDGRGLLYAADHSVDEELDLWIADSAIFRADFEWGDLEEWSAAAP
jgi:hypothetical protein